MRRTSGNIGGSRRAPTALLVVALCLLPGIVSAADADSDGYVIGIEDVLLVMMPDHPELTVTVPVRPDGRISLPLVDDVVAAGMTPDQLKQNLMERYQGYVTVPNISVLVNAIHSLKIYVLGEVKNPGVFDVQRPVRLLQSIALAGGFTEFASKEKVIVLREREGKQERIEVNLKKVYSGEDVDANQVLQSGDTVVVP